MLDLREISRTCVMFSLCAVAGCALQPEAQFVGWGGLGWEDERERSWEVCSYQPVKQRRRTVDVYRIVREDGAEITAYF